MKHKLKVGLSVLYTAVILGSCIWLLAPATASAACGANQCVYANQCYSSGACLSNGQYCSGDRWLSKKDSAAYCTSK